MTNLKQQRIDQLYEQQRLAGAAACVIGVDEVGRGSVAGPLTVAAVALPLDPVIEGLNDSKKLSAKKREALDILIREHALGIGIFHVQPSQIDAIKMSQALRLAMQEAIESCQSNCKKLADLVLIDGNPMNIHPREQAIIKGDAKIACIAAASIVAKVTRDAMMVELHDKYPQYDFASNKGYASATHIKAIQTYGVCAEHRLSFCQNFLQ